MSGIPFGCSAQGYSQSDRKTIRMKKVPMMGGIHAVSAMMIFLRNGNLPNIRMTCGGGAVVGVEPAATAD
jgi:hypothetical protein